MDEMKKGGMTPGRRIQEWNIVLNEYKASKSKTEERVKAAEEWWKLRNAAEELKEGVNYGAGFKPKSGWLHNVIVTKHADAMDNYPEPLILPREMNDKQEAKTLTSILPEILEANDFEQTYSDAWWDKLKTGTAVYKVTWNQDKLNGLGDVDITAVDLLSIYWTPGVDDIQKAKYVFHVAWEDNDTLKDMYPELEGKLRGGKPFMPSKYRTDDKVTEEDKSLLVDVYYKKRGVVHFAKYCEDVILYSTEQFFEEESSIQGEDKSGQQTAVEQPDVERDAVPFTGDMGMEKDSFGTDGGSGIYDDGMYPFVFDPLFPIKGSPCGYGYVDLCQNAQIQLDLMDSASLKNFMVGATPRYFARNDGSVNEQEFLDLTKPIVHVDGMIDDNVLRPMAYNALSGNYLNAYNNKITELRETSGNTETATGSGASGVTSASGIAALQEASGKSSRDASKAAYRAYKKLVRMVIERIRQFYDLPRTFRITGTNGEESFVPYSNEGLMPQPLGNVMGTDMGYRLPDFDIRIEVQKKNAYTRTAQNDLAIQFFQMGFFNPALAPQALACIQMMDFDGKTEMEMMIRQNAMMQQMQMMMNPMAAAGQPLPAGGGEKPEGTEGSQGRENPIVERARERANNAASEG